MNSHSDAQANNVLLSANFPTSADSASLYCSTDQTNSMIKQTSTSTEPIAGELIVRNGPDRGVSRSLLVPITLVGSAESCDLRILDETVRAVHCAISVTPDGPHLRSVGGLTPVNDRPSS